MILQVEEAMDRCLHFNVPEDDDAHLVVLPLPHGVSAATEAHYVEQLVKMIQSKEKYDDAIPQKLVIDTPTEVASEMSNFMKEHVGYQSHLTFTIALASGSESKYQYSTKLYQPTVINHVRRKILADHSSERWEDTALEGFRICFENADEDAPILAFFDTTLLSEEVEDSIDEQKPGFDKERHLTPLEESIDKSITAATRILTEMKYMEKREARMRKTADSINSRVRWFSYLSIAVLLVVTYVQVTYLKRYFHKKKLL